MVTTLLKKSLRCVFYTCFLPPSIKRSRAFPFLISGKALNLTGSRAGWYSATGNECLWSAAPTQDCLRPPGWQQGRHTFTSGRICLLRSDNYITTVCLLNKHRVFRANGLSEWVGQLPGLLHGRSCEHIHSILRYKLLINSRLLISLYVILAYTGLEFLGTILR